MSDKKYLSSLILAIFLLIIFVAVFFFSPEREKKSLERNEIKEIRIGENIFQAEIASSLEKRNQGLSGRKKLCEKCSMLFLFSEKGLHSFWMKEMNFDLDMIWIDEDEIVDIAKDVSRKKEREIIKPSREADKVLEINAGLADRLGIRVGDKIEF